MPRPPPRSTLFPYTTLFRSFPKRGSDGVVRVMDALKEIDFRLLLEQLPAIVWATDRDLCFHYARGAGLVARSEEHTSELQSHHDLVCRLLLEKKKTNNNCTL